MKGKNRMNKEQKLQFSRLLDKLNYGETIEIPIDKIQLFAQESNYNCFTFWFDNTQQSIVKMEVYNP